MDRVHSCHIDNKRDLFIYVCICIRILIRFKSQPTLPRYDHLCMHAAQSRQRRSPHHRQMRLPAHEHQDTESPATGPRPRGWFCISACLCDGVTCFPRVRHCLLCGWILHGCILETKDYIACALDVCALHARAVRRTQCAIQNAEYDWGNDSADGKHHVDKQRYDSNKQCLQHLFLEIFFLLCICLHPGRDRPTNAVTASPHSRRVAELRPVPRVHLRDGGHLVHHSECRCLALLSANLDT